MSQKFGWRSEKKAAKSKKGDERPIFCFVFLVLPFLFNLNSTVFSYAVVRTPLLQILYLSLNQQARSS